MFYNELPTKQIVNPYTMALLSSSSVKNKCSPLNLNNQFIQPIIIPFPKPLPNNLYKNEYVLLYLKFPIDLIIQLLNFPIKI